MGKQEILDAEEDLRDAQRAYDQSLKDAQEAIEWKFKMMDNLVGAYQKLNQVKIDNYDPTN